MSGPATTSTISPPGRIPALLQPDARDGRPAGTSRCDRGRHRPPVRHPGGGGGDLRGSRAAGPLRRWCLPGRIGGRRGHVAIMSLYVDEHLAHRRPSPARGTTSSRDGTRVMTSTRPAPTVKLAVGGRHRAGASGANLCDAARSWSTWIGSPDRRRRPGPDPGRPSSTVFARRGPATTGWTGVGPRRTPASRPVQRRSPRSTADEQYEARQLRSSPRSTETDWVRFARSLPCPGRPGSAPRGAVSRPRDLHGHPYRGPAARGRRLSTRMTTSRSLSRDPEPSHDRRGRGRYGRPSRRCGRAHRRGAVPRVTGDLPSRTRLHLLDVVLVGGERQPAVLGRRRCR